MRYLRYRRKENTQRLCGATADLRTRDCWNNRGGRASRPELEIRPEGGLLSSCSVRALLLLRAKVLFTVCAIQESGRYRRFSAEWRRVFGVRAGNELGGAARRDRDSLTSRVREGSFRRAGQHVLEGDPQGTNRTARDSGGIGSGTDRAASHDACSLCRRFCSHHGPATLAPAEKPPVGRRGLVGFLRRACAWAGGRTDRRKRSGRRSGCCTTWAVVAAGAGPDSPRRSGPVVRL